MTETEIDYEGLAQSALRGVVRTVLARVAEGDKLPGNHHFYISFNTNGEGVSVSKRLREQYPEEMTIVLQHRYWGLLVHDDRFEVNLTFNSIPERLVVPFAAVKVFFDPSVPYGLQFDTAGAASAEASQQPQSSTRHQSMTKPSGQKRTRPSTIKPALISSAPTKPGAGKAAGRDRPQAVEPAHAKMPADPAAETAEIHKPAQLPKQAAIPAASAAAALPDLPPADVKPPGQVVRLDAFRKK